jgi:hypothetical protein
MSYVDGSIEDRGRDLEKDSMEFEYFEYKFAAEEPGQARRIASMLAEQGYHSLQRDTLDLLRRYLPNGAGETQSEPLTRARTIDVLVPATDRTARILVCERPSPEGGAVVAVVVVGRSQDDAQRGRTAAKIALDAKGGRDGAPGPQPAGENGRGRASRLRQEWLRALGVATADGAEAPASSPRPLASAQTLFALQGAPSMLGRPSVLRSRLDKAAAGAGAAGRGADPAALDGLTAEGLIDRVFVLMCRESGQIVGVGKDAAEVQAAMQLSLRCPHCRRPLSEEGQDVLYSLSPQGEEFIKSARWLREALESSLRRRNCDAVVLAEPSNGRIDGAACYRDAVLVFRLRDGAPAEDDIRSLQRAAAEFEKVAPGVPVRGIVVTTQPVPAPAAAAATDGGAPCVFLNASLLDESLDRMLEDLKRDAFSRLTGTTLEFIRPDPSTLLIRPSA